MLFYTLSNGWIVNATTSNNSQQTSPIQQGDPVSVNEPAASLIKTFEESIGPAFQADTGYPYQGEARRSGTSCKHDT